MTLLDSICCPRHHLRTAVVWEDPSAGPPCFQTYHHLLVTSLNLAKSLREVVSSDSPIAIHGENCPHVLAAILSVMSLPVPIRCRQPGGVVRGVACLPVSPRGELAKEQERILDRCEVQIVLVEITTLEEFLSSCEKWVVLHLVAMDTSLLSFGFVIASIASLGSSQEQQKCSISSLKGLDEAALACYRRECAMSCFPCTQDDGRTHSSHPETNETPAIGQATLSTCPTTPTCPNDGCPAGDEYPECRIAYVLSTSGTTGIPKLVHVPHCSIVPNIVDLRSRFNITPDDVIFNAAPLTFDPSFVEIFLAFSTASQLLVVPEAVKRVPTCLSDILFRRHYASVLQITPTLFYRFDEGVLREILGADSHVRVLAFGGEACPEKEKLARWRSPQNKTELYNIYGTTEVSSWATCHQLILPAPPPSAAAPAPPLSTAAPAPPSSGVPLGEALLGTWVELRDPETGGGVASGGQGVIWIGGGYRVCLVDGERGCPTGQGNSERPIGPCIMRCSGDSGCLDNQGQLTYAGRSDRQIKHWGHRINLDRIQSAISNLEGISSCVVVFLVPEPGSTPQSPHLSINRAKLRAFVVLESTEASLPSGAAALWGRMRETLPPHSIPETLAVVKAFPMTPHGKVDITSLLDRKGEVHLSHTPGLHPEVFSVDYITSLLVSIVTTVSSLTVCPPMDAKLTDMGLNSFDIIRVANQIEVELEGQFVSHDSHMTKLVEKLLDNDIGHVAEYILTEISSHGLGKDVADSTNARKRFLQPNSDTLQASKKPKNSSVGSHAGHVTVECWRRGQYFINGNLQNLEEKSANAESMVCKQGDIGLRIHWKVNTHKCIDASPLLVQITGRRHSLPLKGDPELVPPKDDTVPLMGVSRVIYVGSHSHLFLALEVESGRVLWHCELGGRVESSACPSLCGQYIIVGCYDGSLYTMAVSTGAVHWRYQSGLEGVESAHQPIKSSPCTDPHTGLVWFGSHDQHLYAVDIYRKQKVWRLHPGGGAIFSSPCIDADQRIIFCATLWGIIAAFNLDSGELVWSYSAPKPIFSSPSLLLSHQRLVIGCVNGSVYSLSLQTGQEVCRADTEGSVFSSCCVLHCQPRRFRTNFPDSDPDPPAKTIDTESHTGTGIGLAMESHTGTKIICGSHSKHLYCWNENMELEWRTELDSEVYSTPFCHYFPSTGMECVCVGSTAGVLYLVDPNSGRVLCQERLPGEVFSSPVCMGDAIVLGCRDDYLYCITVVCQYKN